MFRFLKEYLCAPDTIGAIAPSSRYLAASMTAFIDFDKARCIVEYGAGTGVFTREVAAGKRRDTTYIVIEQNDRFYEMLRKQFHGMPGVVLIHGDAGNVCGYLREQGFSHADYIISGLPLRLFPGRCPAEYCRRRKRPSEPKACLLHFSIHCCGKAFWNNISISRGLYGSGEISPRHMCCT